MNTVVKSILIVDDQEGLRLTMAALFEDEGYDVVAVESGYKAVEEVKNKKYDIVFLDIKMPGLNGVDTLREIKKISPEMVVFMMTAYAMDSLIEEAIREGAAAIFYKPFDIEKIINAIKNIDGNTSILLVDDEESFLESFSELLKENGYSVRITKSGIEAIEIINNELVDIVFMDVVMPEVSGVEILKRMKESVSEKKIPIVIMLSAYEVNDRIQEALLLGAQDFIKKPVSIDKIKKTIKKYTSRNTST